MHARTIHEIIPEIVRHIAMQFPVTSITSIAIYGKKELLYKRNWKNNASYEITGRDDIYYGNASSLCVCALGMQGEPVEFHIPAGAIDV